MAERSGCVRRWFSADAGDAAEVRVLGFWGRRGALMTPPPIEVLGAGGECVGGEAAVAPPRPRTAGGAGEECVVGFRQRRGPT
jgi:hypothetical protein